MLTCSLRDGRRTDITYMCQRPPSLRGRASPARALFFEGRGHRCQDRKSRVRTLSSPSLAPSSSPCPPPHTHARTQARTQHRTAQHMLTVVTCPLHSRSDGRSRQFGFVGFRTPEEAHAAVKYFNKSFMNTFRLGVEVRPRVHRCT